MINGGHPFDPCLTFVKLNLFICIFFFYSPNKEQFGIEQRNLVYLKWSYNHEKLFQTKTYLLSMVGPQPSQAMARPQPNRAMSVLH